MFGGGTVQGIVARPEPGGGKAGPVGSAAIVIAAQIMVAPDAMVRAMQLVVIFIAEQSLVLPVFRRRSEGPTAAALEIRRHLCGCGLRLSCVRATGVLPHGSKFRRLSCRAAFARIA